MFSQKNLTNRRQFLERSMWGFGSAFLLPSLLASCTDHRIPDPDSGPLLGDPTSVQFDWNDNAKIAVTTALGMIPEVGEILSGLVDILWPSTKEDVWGEIKDQVEALIDQKLSDVVYQQVSGDLQGLSAVIGKYQDELRNGSSTEINNKWGDVCDFFAYAKPQFQLDDYKVLLLPLFAQFANMYLAVLRDGVAFGKSWGRTDKDYTSDLAALQTAISDCTNYVNQVYDFEYQAAVIPISLLKRDPHLCEPFRYANTFVRQMTLTVLDYRDTWKYYDISKYPNGAQNPDGTKIEILTREVYTDPIGTCDDSGDIVIATPAPTQFPTQLTVWGHDRVNAVQLTYPTGSGPGGRDVTPIMGYIGSDGTNKPPYGGVFNLSADNPIVTAGGLTGDHLFAFWFTFLDGTKTPRLGGGYPGGDEFKFLIPNHALSSIHINGVSVFYGSADSAVFGFKYWPWPQESLNAVRRIYITSPKEYLAADLAKAFPKLGITEGLINAELKAARLAYWAYVKARAL